MKNHIISASILALLMVSACSGGDEAAEPEMAAEEPGATTEPSMETAADMPASAGQPQVEDRNAASGGIPQRPLWGELHLHTSWSADAIASGTRVDPDMALRFAKGEEVMASSGQPAQLARPYDWMMIADHSDAMGLMAGVLEGDPALMEDPVMQGWHDGMVEGGEAASAVMMDVIARQGNGELPEAMTDNVVMFDTWKKFTGIIESHNQPGTFSAIIGFEWTSNYGGGNNLHRNIMYRDGKDIADMVRPLNTFDTEIPNELWDWMENFEATTGGKILAVPHNGNLSNGLMFATETPDGQPIDAAWTEARQRWERLYEVTQGKGTSEQHPSLAPGDEFANFEIWDKGNLNVVPKTPGMIDFEYAREALKRGFQLEEEFGTNPFKFGLVGSTDAHTGLSTTEENNFFGKFLSSEPGPERSSGNAFDFDGRTVKDWKLGASGLTGVWAEENTRASIWDAMYRREVYATTGTRITVRFFGGFGYDSVDLDSGDWVGDAYSGGVPMGSDLPAASGDTAPTFLVAAMKDPENGNLDRIQIIKGFLNEDGSTGEAIYDVALSDGRTDGSEPVGDTVDVATATYTNDIGASQLTAVWTDPDFDPGQKAFYYARVIEIPTPRWSAFDQVRYEEADFPDDALFTVQERAFTSPIWYDPAG